MDEEQERNFNGWIKSKNLIKLYTFRPQFLCKPSCKIPVYLNLLHFISCDNNLSTETAILKKLIN